MTVGPTTVRQCGCRSRSTFSPLVSTFSGNPMTAPSVVNSGVSSRTPTTVTPSTE